MFSTVEGVSLPPEGTILTFCCFCESPSRFLAGATDEELAQCVPHLASLRNLTSLRLNGSQLTDTGLDELATLRHLDSLDVEHTKVTDEGVARLQSRLPALQITH